MSRSTEDEKDFRTESRSYIERNTGNAATYLLRAIYKNKSEYIEQKLPIKIVLIMNNGRESTKKYCTLHQDGQYLVEEINSGTNVQDEEEKKITLEKIKKLIQNKQISFEMPKELEQYIVGTYDIPEEVKIIVEEIEKRKLHKNTIGEEMEH